MTLTYQLVCVLIIMLMSYLPRVLPLVIFRKPIKSRYLKSVLYYMPYAVLASLTFPAIFYSTGSVATASIGTAIALALSFFKVNLAIVAVISIAAVFGFGFIL